MSDKDPDRNYDNFLEAYLDYRKDEFVPDKFHLWAGISMVAAALERKVWTPQANIIHFPNVYVLLVSLPGIGKSSAITPAVNMLRDMTRETKSLRILPSQMTEAKLIELMEHPNTFVYKGNHIGHCSGYYHASEASNSLKDLYGGFIDTITAFYDCDSVWEKGTIKGGNIRLQNICFNLLAGCTFDYLGKLITDDNIMGGFASRLIYVAQDQVMKRKSRWASVTRSRTTIEYEKLLEDLTRIHEMVGPFAADPAFVEAYEKWFEEYDMRRQALESEKLQSILVRRSSNMIKLCMILSAAESSSRILEEHHWTRALELMDEVEKILPKMLREGKAKETKSQSGINAALFRELERAPNQTLSKSQLVQRMTLAGFQSVEVERTLEAFIQENSVIKIYKTNDQNVKVNLIGDPNNYL